MSRSPSVASNDRFSVVSGLTSNTFYPPNPQNVNPAPAYVAQFGASQVVAATTRPSSSDDEDTLESKKEVQFSAPAMSLVNAFLDYLLFSFLSTARSTNLYVLRPAVTEVLKARLARDAIASAEEELQELLAGGEDEEENNTKQNAAEHNRNWDLELVWKRTRLRVMVYMRLGEMEDEDEERYVNEEELFHGSERRFSQTSGLVSWAAAIFLTGVLEYIAEQTLQAAGSAAYSRNRRQTSIGEEVKQLVEEHDVEKVALNSTLGRLWRIWKKSVRSTSQTVQPGTPSHRFSRLSNENIYSTTGMSRGSLGNGVDGSVNGEANGPMMRLDEVPEMQYPEHVLASNIPLPMGDRLRDVDEIEVPGLARDPDAQEEEGGSNMPTGRRNSFTGPSAYQANGGLPTPDSTDMANESVPAVRPLFSRKRSTSVPNPVRTPMALDDLPGAWPLETPLERLREEQGDGEQKSPAEEMAAQKRASMDVAPLFDKVASNEPVEETEEQKLKNKRHGLVDGAIAGASAAGIAAAAAAYGSKHEDKADTDSAVPVLDNRNVEELDKRKSLLDMKSFIVPSPAAGEGQDAVQIMHARKTSLSQPSTPPMMIRTSSGESTASDESRKSDASRKTYTLRKKDLPQQALATRQHMPDVVDVGRSAQGNGIGVARTSDVVSPVRGESGEEARGPAKRPSRLVLGATPPRNNFSNSPTLMRTASPKGSLSEFREGRSLTSRTSQPDFSTKEVKPPSPDEQASNMPYKVPTKRRSIPGAAFTSTATTPVAEKNPHRQSWSAAVQQQREQAEAGVARPVSVPALPMMPAAHRSTTSLHQDVPVQEHPIVQRMAERKEKKPSVDMAAEPQERALTSASIRGPEDFDAFMQDADTMKYTLTPETVRDGPAQTRNQPAELSSAPSVSRRSAPPPIDTSDRRTGRSQVSKQATSAVPDKREAERQSRDLEKRRSVSRPPTRNKSAHRRSGLMAREPQVVTESTRDFADWIRSTGPERPEQEVKPVINPATMSTTSLHSLRSAHINGASASRSSSIVSTDRERERTKSLTKSAIDNENIPPVPPVPAKAAKKALRARGASGAGDSNTDLIDFIRSGPGEDGQHRISRSVAPFRNTMDSDQFDALDVRTNNERPPELNLKTNVDGGLSLRNAKSQSSMKGRASPSNMNTRAGAALVGNGNASTTVHPAHSGQPQRLAATNLSANNNAALSPISAGGATPARKRHRNKDPYAIDMDEEHDDLLTALPKNKRQEESLADFLNNNEPPKDNGPRPLVNGSSAQPKSILNKSRANSMNSLRGANAADAAVGASGRTKSMQSSNGPKASYASSITSNTSAARRPGSRQANGSPLPLMPNNGRKLEAKGSGSASQPGPGVLKKPSQTKELADFLKESGPDEDDKSAPAPNINRRSKLSPKETEKARKKAEKDAMKNKEGGQKLGFFARLTGRKKNTWLDIP